MRLLALDPGETTGYAVLDSDGSIRKTPMPTGDMPFGLLSGLERLTKFLFKQNPKDFDAVIIEKYTVLPTKVSSHIGSEVETVQAVGICKAFAYCAGIPFHLSSPTKNPIYAKWSGMNPEKMGSHSKTHWVYAYNHGYGYLVEKGHISPKVKDIKNVFG